jgi:hypothetical protein
MYGLFDKEHAVITGKSAEEMLGTLVDEAPSEVGKADDVSGHHC